MVDGLSQLEIFYRFGVALVIGFLVGLQREYSHGGQDREIFAGVRTFALAGLLGGVAALGADQLATPWVFVGLLASLGGLLIAAYYLSSQQGDHGLTTELALLLTACCGALSYWGHLQLTAALAVAITALLSFKPELHALARRITREDIYATLKFAAITIIVLPLLPDRSVAPPPFDVLNPHKIGTLVVFISGISFLGYVLFQIVGARRGIGLTGLLGGLVSSTAVTLSFAQRSRQEPALSRLYALAITVAWTIMFGRVLVIVAVLNAALLAVVWPPLLAGIVAGLGYCAYLYLAREDGAATDLQLTNPFELRPALVFGLIYTGILLVATVLPTYLGNAGLYLSSLLAAVVDVDAITLSLADLSAGSGVVSLRSAALAVALAAVTNTVVKGGIVVVAGAPALRRAMIPSLALMLGASGAGAAAMYLLA